ncbi:hypothetical protein WA577_007388, partial [Blastocystis sp. JDR]
FEKVPQCAVCGAFVSESCRHCPHCHLDFDDSLFAQHACVAEESQQQTTTQSPIHTARQMLMQLELAIPFACLTKKARVYWTAEKRAAWQMKVRRANSGSELMTCLFILEKNIAKGTFQRWFKWSIPVMEYQSQIRTLASFFVRLFGVDDAIRFTIGQSEGGTEGANHEEEEKSHSVQKRKSASKKKRRREEKS